MKKPFECSLRREGFRGTVVKVWRCTTDLAGSTGVQKLRGKPRSSGSFSYLLLTIALIVFLTGCIKRIAVNSLAGALTEGSADVYARDNDPTLVGEALPFALKTMEVLLEQSPDNRQLLLSAASGFTQYAHGFVLQPANTLEFSDLAAARKERTRAKALFIRARDYGLKALQLDHPDIAERLQADPEAAVSLTKEKDVTALYWTGVAWGSAISVAKDDMALVSEVPIVRGLLGRALVLDPDWGSGAIHEFFIVFDAGRTAGEGGGVAKAEEHFKRAVELNSGRSVGPLVALAESVCVRQQDQNRFVALLNEALAFDVDQYPENRLANILAQKKAAELLDNMEHLFFLDASASSDGRQMKQ